MRQPVFLAAKQTSRAAASNKGVDVGNIIEERRCLKNGHTVFGLTQPTLHNFINRLTHKNGA
jgi:hypothetical protein